MRRIAVVSLLASLTALACGNQNDAAKPGDPKVAEAKTEPTVTPTPPGSDPSITPTIAAPSEPEPPPADDFGDEFCATIIPCYQKLEFAGNFLADVSVDIEPDGSVSAVSFTGEAPKPVQSCITDAIKNTRLTAYNGKPGRARCTKSGQLMGGTQMIMSDRTYELREPTPSKAEVNAKHGKPDDAKPEGKAKAG